MTADARMSFALACGRIVTASPPGLLVVEVPHAGTEMDDRAVSFRQVTARALDAGALVADADIGSDLVWEDSERHGVSRVIATTSRYVIDLNTAPRFPTAYEEKMPEPLNNLRRRSACGLRWSAPPLPRAELERRVETYLEPYHRAVAERLEQARTVSGAAVLLSSHTFPGDQVPVDVDVVLGTAHETSAPRELRDRIADCFRRGGLRVALEAPFPGGLSLARHGRPAEGVSAVQIEIRRSLLSQAIHDGEVVRFAVEPTGLERLKALMVDVSHAVVAWTDERTSGVASSPRRPVAEVSP